MGKFIYFPCSKSGKILRGFCPSIADGNNPDTILEIRGIGFLKI